MNDASDDQPLEKIDRVQRLATELADRILDAQIGGCVIPSEQIVSLMGAARLLQDHGAPWPPLVEQVLLEWADGLAAERQAAVDAEAVP